MITSSDMTDPLFVKLESADKTKYLALGALMFTAECLKAGIDEDSIEDSPYPFTPFRIMQVLTLMAICKDYLGSDFREIRDGLTIDVYQAKYKSLTDELNELLANFTPTMCGYEAEGDNSGTGSVSVSWERA